MPSSVDTPPFDPSTIEHTRRISEYDYITDGTTNNFGTYYLSGINQVDGYMVCVFDAASDIQLWSSFEDDESLPGEIFFLNPTGSTVTVSLGGGNDTLRYPSSESFPFEVPPGRTLLMVRHANWEWDVFKEGTPNTDTDTNTQGTRSENTIGSSLESSDLSGTGYSFVERATKNLTNGGYEAVRLNVDPSEITQVALRNASLENDGGEQFDRPLLVLPDTDTIDGGGFLLQPEQGVQMVNAAANSPTSWKIASGEKVQPIRTLETIDIEPGYHLARGYGNVWGAAGQFSNSAVSVTENDSFSKAVDGNDLATTPQMFCFTDQYAIAIEDGSGVFAYDWRADTTDGGWNFSGSVDAILPWDETHFLYLDASGLYRFDVDAVSDTQLLSWSIAGTSVKDAAITQDRRHLLFRDDSPRLYIVSFDEYFSSGSDPVRREVTTGDDGTAAPTSIINVTATHDRFYVGTDEGLLGVDRNGLMHRIMYSGSQVGVHGAGHFALAQTRKTMLIVRPDGTVEPTFWRRGSGDLPAASTSDGSLSDLQSLSDRFSFKAAIGTPRGAYIMYDASNASDNIIYRVNVPSVR